MIAVGFKIVTVGESRDRPKGDLRSWVKVPFLKL